MEKTRTKLEIELQRRAPEGDGSFCALHRNPGPI